MGTDHGSESLRAFDDVVEKELLPRCADLDTVLQSVLNPQIAAFVVTTAGPRILLANLKELRPFFVLLLCVPGAAPSTESSIHYRVDVAPHSILKSRGMPNFIGVASGLSAAALAAAPAFCFYQQRLNVPSLPYELIERMVEYQHDDQPSLQRCRPPWLCYAAVVGLCSKWAFGKRTSLCLGSTHPALP